MKKFLTPHELATLLLVLLAPTQISLTDPDLNALQQDSLVEITSVAPDAPDVLLPRLTAQGEAILKKLNPA
ncbi:hypothetical protein PATSB16_05530 [Pandoraea thiooxydans]|uniref:Uncharacterized protein n=1 Tax=Pandoraea thiooxydans TaxID=445709 RepID=A0A0G3ENV8_9BURK|nr:hypothetical protein [Pandoraea thiooxydans]AKJ66987.1 hypothetical protein ABW99_00820 [Pandoraea thiooxydans]APR93895.1 hypothetical protein PATSB16_05530 [Pandoraea thiooxydans]